VNDHVHAAPRRPTRTIGSPEALRLINAREVIIKMAVASTQAVPGRTLHGFLILKVPTFRRGTDSCGMTQEPMPNEKQQGRLTTALRGGQRISAKIF